MSFSGDSSFGDDNPFARTNRENKKPMSEGKNVEDKEKKMDSIQVEKSVEQELQSENTPPFLLNIKENQYKLELSPEKTSKSWNHEKIKKIIISEFIGSGSYKNIYKFANKEGFIFDDYCISLLLADQNSDLGKKELQGHNVNFDLINRTTNQNFINIYQYGYFCRCMNSVKLDDIVNVKLSSWNNYYAGKITKIHAGETYDIYFEEDNTTAKKVKRKEFYFNQECFLKTKCPNPDFDNSVVGVYAIMEYAKGGSLGNRFKLLHSLTGSSIITHKWFSFLSITLIKNICNALKNMHNKGYLHLDIKPANIVLMISESESIPIGENKPEYLSQNEWDFLNNNSIELSKQNRWAIIKNTKIKIIDFGATIKKKEFNVGDIVQLYPKYGNDVTNLENTEITAVIDDEHFQTKKGKIILINDIFDKEGIVDGTPFFMDSDIFLKSADDKGNWRCSHYRGKMNDIWSLGITLFEVLTGSSPWNRNEIKSILKLIIVMQTNNDLLEEYFDLKEFNKLNAWVKTIIRFMLKKNIYERKSCNFYLDKIKDKPIKYIDKLGGYKKKTIKKKKKRKKYKLTKKRN